MDELLPQSPLFVLRDEQLRAMNEVTHAVWIERLVAMLRENVPKAVCDIADEALAVDVERWVSVAVDHGIDDEPSVENWVELCANFPELSGSPLPDWTERVLSRPGLDSEVRIEQIEERLRFGASDGR